MSELQQLKMDFEALGDLYLNEATQARAELMQEIIRARPQLGEGFYRALGAQRSFPGYSWYQQPSRFTHDFLWRSGDGREIPVTQMDESHLRNAISWAQRRLVHACGTSTWLAQAAKYVEALHEFLKEAERRGLRV